MALAFLNNGRYIRKNIAEERIEQQRDSIYLMQYEKLFHNIHTNTQIIDSLNYFQRYMDSLDLTNQKDLLQKVDYLININRQILKQKQIKRCSISSTIHTVE